MQKSIKITIVCVIDKVDSMSKGWESERDNPNRARLLMVHLVSRAGQASVSAGVSGDGGQGTCTLWHPLRCTAGKVPDSG